MGRQVEQRAAQVSLAAEDMLRIWRADRCVQDSSTVFYLQWIKRFRVYCAPYGLDERAELTLSGAQRFIASYVRLRGLDARRLGAARTALYALSRVCQVMRLHPPAWQPPRPVPPPATTLLREYADHLARHRGNPERTVRHKLAHIEKLTAHLAGIGKTWETMTLTDIDAFLIECAGRYARSTAADLAGSARSFARFLLATGRISADLAASIVVPLQPKFERPRRALPWEDVQHLLRAVDRSSPRGLRDYALLLLMSTYGFGSGEVIRLQLQDIDWNARNAQSHAAEDRRRLHAAVAAAGGQGACLLPARRPAAEHSAPLRIRVHEEAVRCLAASSAIRHILVKHAKKAGVNAPYLGSHVLRHSNAARQVDLGTRPRVLSDLLGHRDPGSISAYVRIATETLREVSLPVPTLRW